MAEQSFSRRPLYLQVCDLIVQRIAHGELGPRAMLPSEDELARELGVSMGTMRRALHMLEGEGLLQRRAGRGTTVVDQGSGLAVNRFNGLRHADGHTISGEIELLDQTTGLATPIERERLQLGPRDIVLRTERLRLEEGRPFMHEETSLAVGRFPGCEAGEIGSYRLLALAQRWGVHLTRGNERVTLVEADARVARHLEVEPGQALLQLERVVLASEGQPMEWRKGLCYLADGATYTASM